MKNFKLLVENTIAELKSDISQKLNTMVVGKWKTTNKGIVVDGDVKIFPFAVTDFKINIKFYKVTGTFDCSCLGLTSLINSPEEVHNFNCINNQLETLEYAPKKITGDFNCAINLLSTLKGLPKEIGGSLLANINMLEDIEYIPKVGLHINLFKNNISNLKGIYKVVNGNLNLDNNRIDTMAFFPEQVKGNVDISMNMISDLSSPLRRVDGDFTIQYNYAMNSVSDDVNSIKTMVFPKAEHYSIKQRLYSAQSVFSIRVDQEQGKYKAGDTLKTDFDDFIIITNVKTIDGNIDKLKEEYKHFGELTPEQVKLLSKYKKFDIIEFMLTIKQVCYGEEPPQLKARGFQEKEIRQAFNVGGKISTNTGTIHVIRKF